MKCRYQLTVNFPVHPAFIGDPLLENEAQNEAQNSGLSERQMAIIAAIKADDKITRTKLMKLFNVSKSTIERDLRVMKNLGILYYEGVSNSGKWVLSL